MQIARRALSRRVGDDEQDKREDESDEREEHGV